MNLIPLAIATDERARMPLLRRWRSVIGVPGYLFCFVFFTGCTDQDAASDSKAAPVAESVVEPAIDLVDYGAWPDAVDQRVESDTADYTVVDYWSLSCSPCLKELPELAKLSREQLALGEDAKIQTIGVSLDFDGRKSKPPEHYEPKIRELLNRIDARFENVICQTASDDVFSGLDIPSIPAVFIYDRQGELIRRFVDAGDTAGFTYEEDILPFLDSLD